MLHGADALLTVKQVAEQLGVCGATVYKLCAAGRLPHVRVLNSVRVRSQDLAAYLNKHHGSDQP